MDQETQKEIVSLWDEFVSAGYVYINENGEEREYMRRKELREGRLDHIQNLVERFRDGELSLFDFRREMDGESKQHNFWGFRATNQMFFNMYCNASERQDRAQESSDALQATLPIPEGPDQAAEQIDEFEEHVDDLKTHAENPRKAPQAGYIPAFLSFFWQVQQPNHIPVYYPSARDAYRELGVWKQQNNLATSYAEFWRVTDEIRAIIEDQRDEDAHLWAIEFAVLRHLNSQGTGPDPEPGTYSEFEQTQGGLIDDELQIDITGLHFANRDDIQKRIETALMNGNHILLVGPPGTGMTKLAKQICRSIMSDEYSLVTATADWSTFDTIGGYQPDRDQELTFTPGVILSRFQDSNDQPQNEWLIIDEINRADIDKTFGSLFSALTGEDVVLPFTNADGERIEIIGDPDSRDLTIESHRYYIPRHWRMIATMNTFDKTSLYEMSYAFMRRWAFIHISVPPREDIDGDLVSQFVSLWGKHEVDDDICDEVAAIWRTTNNYREIGPAIVEDIYGYLSMDDQDVVGPIQQHIVPQLEGLRDDDLKDFVEEMSEKTQADEQELQEFVADYYQIPAHRFDDE